MRVLTEDLWVMLISTIRYSMGRQSYMPGLCAEMYAHYKSALTLGQRKQIADEIETELRYVMELRASGALRHAVYPVNVWLGSEGDHKTWETLAMQIRTELEGGS